MSAIVIAPFIMTTIAKLRLRALAFYVIEPDLSAAFAVLVAERTTVASTALCTFTQVYSATMLATILCEYILLKRRSAELNE